MVLDSVETLSGDEGGGGAVGVQRGPKAKAKGTPKQKAKPKATAEIRASPKKPAVRDQVLKKPAANTAGMKRPSTSTGDDDKKDKKVKVSKCFYQRDSTYGFKVDGKQVFTVPRLHLVLSWNLNYHPSTITTHHLSYPETRDLFIHHYSKRK